MSDAQTRLDEAMAKIATLTQVIQEKESPKTELRWDEVQAKFGEQINALVAAQAEVRAQAAPRRRTAGATIMQGGAVKNGNRYFRQLRDFEQDGYTLTFGGEKTLPWDFWMAAQLLQQGNRLMPQQVKPPSTDLLAAVKAMDSTTAGAGDEYVPTNMSNELWTDFFLRSLVAGLLTPVGMTSDPMDLPLGLGTITFRKGRQNQVVSSNTPSTAKSTLTTTEQVADVPWSYTLEEDAVVSLMASIRAEMSRAGAEAIDAFALNADATNAATGNINSDDQNPAEDSYYLSDGQDGIRHQWLVDNTAMGASAAAALADSHITAALADMGKYAATPQQCAYICDVATYLNGFLQLTNVVTVDKYGPQAVVLTGELGRYRGIPIVVSAVHPLTAADGKADAATPANNTKGSVSIINRTMWKLGFRRDLMIEVDRDIQKRSYIMVASFREAVASRGTRATNTHTAGIYNITV